MEILRIAIAGSVGAGKTSFIRSISEIEVVDTDKPSTDEIALFKDKTTVALDFGMFTIVPDQLLYLYGTPGQRRFDFMWDILIRQVQACIVLVDAHRPENFHYGSQILDFVKQRVQIPILIGLTHMDCPSAATPEDIAIALGLQKVTKKPPVVVVNPTQKASIIEALKVLISEIVKPSIL
ncbi:MAG: GTP-binding protein [Aulosira sp. ZfuVER01]|nr:ATP/GTP-binding protein [Aulosira sp. ZfuVER01]MDZ7998691.1 ATP/GTP-binding protein [Aulosira sp. DedVER01a]MDZ8054863.1 ATP/GTP-binding protein [Aulosira sp. ZfuCHP01]